MQVEPPGEDVPDHGHHAEAPPGPLRLTAAVAAGALALGTTGHVFVLAGLLLVVVSQQQAADRGGSGRAGGIAVLLGATAVLVRWGSPSLSAVAGDQAVLGPAVLVGSAAAAASTLFAALAFALAARERVTAVAFGIAAATVAAGPALPHRIGVRAVGLALGVGIALVATRYRRLAPTAAVGAGALALLLAALA